MDIYVQVCWGVELRASEVEECPLAAPIIAVYAQEGRSTGRGAGHWQVPTNLATWSDLAGRDTLSRVITSGR